MNKTTTKRMFKAIEDDDVDALYQILDTHPEALETVGEHNRLVRDKTPLMFAMQCWNTRLATDLLDRGADATATMTGGPETPALSLCMHFAYCDKANHDEWIPLASRLIDGGADPNEGLWPALDGCCQTLERTDMIRLCLDRGADPDSELANSGSTIREMVKINQQLFSPEVLSLFDISANNA